MIQVKEDLLIKLEKDLNTVKFRGIPIGGIVASAIYIELLIGNGDWSLKARAKDMILRYVLLYKTNRSVFKKKSQIKDWTRYKEQALITFSSSRKHIFDISYGIWKNLNQQDTICLVNDSSLLSKFDKSDNPNTVFLSDIPGLSYSKWRESFSEVSKDYNNIVNLFVQESNLPRFIAYRIYNYLISQTQMFMAYEQFLSQVSPRFIIVEYDRFFISSPLVLAAKAVNVPTFTMMHGAVNNGFGYLPILADRLFCWGEGQKELLEKFGHKFQIDTTQIQITGAPQLKKSELTNRVELKNELGIPVEKIVVLLATNTVRIELRHQLVQMFCEVIASNDAFYGIVRLHPSEDPSFYSTYIQNYPSINFDSKLSYEESLSIADLVCIYNSAYGLDAVLRNVPVVIIDVETEGLGQSEDLILSGGIPHLSSPIELRDTLNKFINDQSFREELSLKVQKYADYYCAFFGDAAANQVITIVDKFVCSSPN